MQASLLQIEELDLLFTLLKLKLPNGNLNNVSATGFVQNITRIGSGLLGSSQLIELIGELLAIATIAHYSIALSSRETLNAGLYL